MAAERGRTVLAAALPRGRGRASPYGPMVELLRGRRSAAADDAGRRVSRPAPRRRVAPGPRARRRAGDAAAAGPLERPGAPSAAARGRRGGARRRPCGGARPGVRSSTTCTRPTRRPLDALALPRPPAPRPAAAAGWSAGAARACRPGHRLRRLAAELRARRRGDRVVTLGRLGEDEVADARARRPGRTRTPKLERRVFIESEGLPLFVAEYLAALGAGDEGGPGGRCPRDAQACSARGSAARGRYGAPGARGGRGDRAVLRPRHAARAASGRSDEEAVGGPRGARRRAAWCARLSSPSPPTTSPTRSCARWSTSETGPARRRLLHRRAADGLARRSPGPRRGARRAATSRLAGDRRGAAEQHRLAAEHAAALLANADALEHLRRRSRSATPTRGAARAHRGPPDAPGRLRRRAGELRERGGRGDARARSAALEHKLGAVHQRRGEWERAEARCARALGAARADDARVCGRASRPT